MNEYKVTYKFSGEESAIVEANSEEEARELFLDDMFNWIDGNEFPDRTITSIKLEE